MQGTGRKEDMRTRCQDAASHRWGAGRAGLPAWTHGGRWCHRRSGWGRSARESCRPNPIPEGVDTPRNNLSMKWLCRELGLFRRTEGTGNRERGRGNRQRKHGDRVAAVGLFRRRQGPGNGRPRPGFRIPVPGSQVPVPSPSTKQTQRGREACRPVWATEHYPFRDNELRHHAESIAVPGGRRFVITCFPARDSARPRRSRLAAKRGSASIVWSGPPSDPSLIILNPPPRQKFLNK